MLFLMPNQWYQCSEGNCSLIILGELFWCSDNAPSSASGHRDSCQLKQSHLTWIMNLPVGCSHSEGWCAYFQWDEDMKHYYPQFLFTGPPSLEILQIGPYPNRGSLRIIRASILQAWIIMYLSELFIEHGTDQLGWKCQLHIYTDDSALCISRCILYWFYCHYGLHHSV